MLARALGSRRKDAIIATKVGFRTGPALIHQGLSRQHILLSAEESLKRLRTDYIDVYLVHRIDPYTPVEETLEALDVLVRQGKVRYVGLSNWPAWLTAKAVGLQREHSWAQFRAAEMYYSMIGRDVEHEFVPLALDSGIGILVWSPLAGGFLTGKYSRQNPKGDGGRLAGFNTIPFDRERGYDVVERLKGIAEAHGATPAQVALAWLLAKPVVASVLVGASKLDQLEDNLGAVDLELTPEEMTELNKLTMPAPVYPQWHIDFFSEVSVRDALTASSGKKS
jgi:aryl-alcohol dehydrogenase-like predicted oxidoreductase